MAGNSDGIKQTSRVRRGSKRPKHKGLSLAVAKASNVHVDGTPKDDRFGQASEAVVDDTTCLLESFHTKWVAARARVEV